MDLHTDIDEFSRLMEMVLAAQDFGLGQAEARAIAAEAIERTDSLSDSCDWAAAVLAERVLVTARGEGAQQPHQPRL